MASLDESKIYIDMRTSSFQVLKPGQEVQVKTISQVSTNLDMMQHLLLQAALESENVSDFQPVYCPHRLLQRSSPTGIFIPRSEVMLKLMRGCLYISEPQKLWFN